MAGDGGRDGGKEMAGGGGRDGGKMLSVARVTFACCREEPFRGIAMAAAAPQRRGDGPASAVSSG
eukprot:scaffold4908_cov109-Isochrysis_galbana.AAC.2